MRGRTHLSLSPLCRQPDQSLRRSCVDGSEQICSARFGFEVPFGPRDADITHRWEVIAAIAEISVIFSASTASGRILLGGSFSLMQPVSVDAKTRKRIDGFLRNLFVEGNYCEELRHQLCKDGCSADDLGGLLFAVCTITRGYADGLIDLGEPSAKELKELVRDLGSLANLVDRGNRSPLNPKFDLLALPSDLDKNPLRKHVARLYDMLPGLMRAYSFHLQRFAKFRRALLKRLTPAHFETLRLLLYIEESTGSPH